jgi:hypothetical protein
MQRSGSLGVCVWDEMADGIYIHASRTQYRSTLCIGRRLRGRPRLRTVHQAGPEVEVLRVPDAATYLNNAASVELVNGDSLFVCDDRNEFIRHALWVHP